MTNLDKALNRYWGHVPVSTDKLTRCADIAAVQERLHCVGGNILHARNVGHYVKAAIQSINTAADTNNKYISY